MGKGGFKIIRDKEREDAAAAFRNYARLGLDCCGGILTTACRIRGCCRDISALDLLAVHDTMRLLEYSGENDVVRAVREVYFATCSGRRLRRNEITNRVRRLACEIHCDERTVYRRLGQARRLYMLIRRGYMQSASQGSVQHAAPSAAARGVTVDAINTAQCAADILGDRNALSALTVADGE